MKAPQIALAKFWGGKCVDAEWEEEWQGPIFGARRALPPLAAAATAAARDATTAAGSSSNGNSRSSGLSGCR